VGILSCQCHRLVHVEESQSIVNVFEQTAIEDRVEDDSSVSASFDKVTACSAVPVP